MKKIAIITSSRADWGLLKPVIMAAVNLGWQDWSWQIIATGSHLSFEHGFTASEITEAGFSYEPVEILLSSDTEKGVCSAAGLTLIKFGELFDRIKPDLVLVLGDRFETVCICMAAKIHRIPICHVHGGEISGNYDNSFRWSISHMATYHFPATELASNRIFNLTFGDTRNIHMVGALGCDGLVKRKNEPDNYFVVILHPNTLEDENYDCVKDVLSERSEEIITIIPNADNGRYLVSDWSKTTFTRKKFLDLLMHSKAIIGNSSCGIVESPSLGVPCINVGSRQANRECASSIIDCEPNQESIKKALTKLESKTFQDLMKTDYYMPYKGENVAGKIVEVLNGI